MNNKELRLWAEAKLKLYAEMVRKNVPIIPTELKIDITAFNSILYRIRDKKGKGKEWLRPRFKHDCSQCQFLGNLGGFDYYFHIHGPNTAEIIIRFSNIESFNRTFDITKLSAGLELEEAGK